MRVRLVAAIVVWVLAALAAQPGSANPERGIALYRAGDYGAAFTEFSSLAARGDRDAQYWLGRLFDAGHGVPINATRAFDWFVKSAEQGHAEAQRVIGVYFEQGNVVARSYERAAL